MSTTITGVNTTAITLSPTTPDVLVAGTINATGSFGVYLVQLGSFQAYDSFAGALLAPKGTGFSIQNDSVIETSATISESSISTGILLVSSGTATNFGEIVGAVGISELGASGGYIKNASLIQASEAGLFMDGNGTIVNTGTITAIDGGNGGIELAGGGYILNTGLVDGSVYVLNIGPGQTSTSSAIGVTIQNTGTVIGVIEASSGTITNNGAAAALVDTYGVILNAGNVTAASGNAVTLGKQGLVYNYGKITASNGNGIVNSTNEYGRVYNYGQITASGTAIIGGRYIYNSGSIIGAHGIYVTFAPVFDAVTNTGTISATNGSGVQFASYGQMINTGTVTAAGPNLGVLLRNGGYVNNYGLITGGRAVAINNEATTVGYLYNSGTIIGTTYGGAYLAIGSVYNTGLIKGVSYGVTINGGGYVYNSGTIIAAGTNVTAPIGVTIGGGNTVAYAGVANTGLVSGQSYGIVLNSYDNYVYNTGTVIGGAGISIGRNGSSYVYNSGLVKARASGGVGIALSSRYASLTNTGTIAAAAGTGVEAGQNGFIYNYGMITGGVAAMSAQNNVVYNYGKIIGGQTGLIAGGANIYNQGTIAATGTAIAFSFGGVVYNYARITGGQDGVVMNGGSTVYNAGTIAGATYAVDFIQGADAANEVIMTQGAVFIGTVNGGGDAILDLAAGGKKTGVIPTDFTGFETLIVDKRAHWDLPAGSFASLDNSGTAILASGALTLGSLSGAGTLILSGGTLALTGSAAAGGTIEFAAHLETLSLGPAGFGATIAHFTTGDVIDLVSLASTNVTSLSFARGTLSIFESSTSMTIDFGAHTSFANETFIAFADGDGTGISLQSTAAMNFVTPSAAPPALSLPALSSHYLATARPAPATAAPVTTAQSGWLSHELLTTLQPPAAVTLHI